MSVFYKVLIFGLLALFLGSWWLFDGIKNPSKTKEPYDFNVMNYIRSIALILFGLIFLFSLFFIKK